MSNVIELPNAPPPDPDITAKKELAVTLYKLQRLTMAQAHIAGLVELLPVKEALESIALMIIDQRDVVVADFMEDTDNEDNGE